MSDVEEVEPVNDDREGGFGIVPRSLRGHLSGYEIAVYVALSWRVNEFGECFLRHQRLADEAGISLATCKRTLEGLREKDIVTWEPKVGEHGGVLCNKYRLEVFAGRGGGSLRSGGSLTQSEGVGLTERQNENPLTRPQEEPPVGPPDETPSKPKNRASQLAEGWRPHQKHIDWASANRIDIGREFAQFRDHHLARGSKFVDWDRAFWTWLRNAKSYGRTGTTQVQIRPHDGGAAKVMTGDEWREKHG